MAQPPLLFKEGNKTVSEARMRMRSVVVLLLGVILFGCAGQQQAPAGENNASAPAMKAEAHSNAVQMMRGILYPASNVIFAAQDQNPADVKPADDPSTAPNPLMSSYGGWQAVENAGIALAESANLLIIPRKCQNGKDLPITDPEWPMLVQGLRDAGMAAYNAAQSKNQDNILMAADTMTTACAACHDKYRETVTIEERCTPAKK
jgi:hypothetical protein